MTVVYLDFETFSEVPISHGTYVYANSAEVLCCTYAVNDGPVQCIDFTSGGTRECIDTIIRHASVVVAHNAMFDRNVMRCSKILQVPPINKWRCTMVNALAHGLPGSLRKLCEVLKVPSSSAKLDGNRLISLFCKPLGKNRKIRRATRETHPKDWALFIEYAKMDVEATREVWQRLPKWNYGEEGVGAFERNLWHLDQKMNDRGVPVDIPLVNAVISAVSIAQKNLRKDVATHTRGQVNAATERDKMLGFILAEYGIGLDDITSSTVKKLLDRDDLDPGLKTLLEMRAQVSQTSTAKYSAFLRAATRDRVCGMIQFCGAARTGRDAARTVQLQNLTRGSLSPEEVETAIDTFKGGYADIIYQNVINVASSLVRSVINAPKGQKFVVSDLSNIEGRGLAWLADETWKVKAFRDFDTGIGADIYKLAYARAFNISPDDVSKDGRMIGKVMELALGYAGGTMAFASFVNIYGLNVEKMAIVAWGTLPKDTLKASQEFITWQQSLGRSYPMSDRAATVCETFKQLWRDAHPKTTLLWRALGDGFREVCETQDKVVTHNRLKIDKYKAWLRIKLPSGRYLCYPAPQVADDGQLSFMGTNGYTRKWERIKTFGGKLTENITQATARDFMFSTLQAIEIAGYPIVLRVHDEVVCEVPDKPKYNEKELSSLLATNPSWGAGMPLAAAGYEAYRYRKG